MKDTFDLENTVLLYSADANANKDTNIILNIIFSCIMHMYVLHIICAVSYMRFISFSKQRF